MDENFINEQDRQMNEAELTAIIGRGEDSRHQFKRDFSNIDSLAAELIAFANTRGGLLLIGVDDGGHVSGLDASDVSRLNQCHGIRRTSAALKLSIV